MNSNVKQQYLAKPLPPHTPESTLLRATLKCKTDPDQALYDHLSRAPNFNNNCDHKHKVFIIIQLSHE